MLHINDLSRRIARYRTQIDDAVAHVLASGRLILGPEVAEFEKSFAAFLDSPHCIGVANGTDALRIALLAAGVTRGDRIATAANAGMYATTAILALGAEPLFLDVDSSHAVRLAEVERAAESGAKTIVVTHLYGLAVADIGEMAAYCRSRGVVLIEDCAQAHGAIVAGRRVGSFGDAGCFSFYPTKNLGGVGDGGAIVTNDEGFAARVRRLRQYGWAGKYTVETPAGSNSRLDELQAAVLSALLPHLDADNARRRAIAARYSAGLKPDITRPPEAGSAYVAHLYVIRTRNRESLRRHLEKSGIGTDIHYPIPDHRQHILKAACADVHLPITERHAEEVLTLPCFPEMSDEEVTCVIDAVNGWSP
jgi:dTDP-3-amino-2,3,6-trideoxy-4-keto-D-glucose/dTDP-3-amino-3,4,6-trideoxy-alpha-D-glucose/dTDP-2,6-dideoxy-D-kanosamine transaminase